MQAHDVFKLIHGFARDGRNGRVLNSKDGNGLPPIDADADIGLGEIAVEGGEIRKPAQEPGDVEGLGTRGEEEEKREEPEKTHLFLVLPPLKQE